MRVPTNLFFQEKIAMMEEHFEKISRLYQQSVNGKKLLAPSDDPVLASRIQLTTDYKKELESYSQNEKVALNRAKLFESSITASVGVVAKVKELIQTAASDTMGDGERRSIAQQLTGYLNNLLSSVNTKDSNGEYIYSGYNSSAQPYVQQGNFVYQGTINSTVINIGPDVSTVYNTSGFNVYGDILTGNGTFTVKIPGVNTGTAMTSPGSVVNAATYVEDTYTLTFVTNAAGRLAYQVVGASSGQVIPAPPATIPTDAPDYLPDSDITFNGLSIHVKGEPNVGDAFQVAPSTKDNIFNTLQGLINTLNTPINNDPVQRAKFHQELSQYNDSMAQAYTHLLNFQSDIGSQVQIIEKQAATNAAALFQQEEISKELGEVPITEVYSKITQENFYLQATVDAYKQIEQTLLELLRM